MIPKIIHYCWFGGGEKPELVRKCIASWEKYCPDWEIKEWNESNFDVSQNEFAKNAYEQRKWAFVSDVARVTIVYNRGGVYLDTDVELLASINELLKYHSFFSFESMRMVATGLGFGAEKGCLFLEKMIEQYTRETTFRTAPAINTESLKAICPRLLLNGLETQEIDGNLFLSVKEYGKFAVHHAMMSWVEGVEHDPNKRKKRKKSKIGKRIQKSLQQYEKFEFVKKHFGEKGEKIYTFLAYDFFDTGLFCLAKRKASKIIKRLRRKT